MREGEKEREKERERERERLSEIGWMECGVGRDSE